MTAYNIARVFTKRETAKSAWSGRIGHVELVADVKSMTLDGAKLPDASIEYLLNFSLQSLQDAYAGAEDLAEATGSWEKKRDALLDGTIGVRGSGGGMSDEDRAAYYVAEQAVRAKVGTDAWKEMDDEARVARTESAIEKLRTADADAFEAAVAARVAHVVEQRQKRAAEKAALGGLGVGVDL